MDNEKYVTKEVHDLHISRLEAIMEKNLAKHETIANGIKSDFDNLRTEIKGDIKAINIRIDDMKTEQSNALTKWGIIVALFVGFIQIFISVFLK